MYYCFMKSTICSLLLAGDEQGLSLIKFDSGASPDIDSSWQYSQSIFHDVLHQLELYFDGKLKHFDLPLKPRGTKFQLEVLSELQKIPYASTVSYSDIAQRIGRPKAVRAVGAANGANPIPIIIPCHRVIGSNGKLTGFAGGLATKQALLKLEAENSP